MLMKAIAESASKKESLSDSAAYARFPVYRDESMHECQSVGLTGRVDAVANGEWGALQNAMGNAWYPDLFSAASPMRGVQGYRFSIDEWTGIRHGVAAE